MYSVVDTSNKVLAMASELHDAIALCQGPFKIDEPLRHVIDDTGKIVYPIQGEENESS